MRRFTKFFCIVITSMLLGLGLLGFATVSANDDIMVIIDSVILDFEDQGPVIVEGRTLVPVRCVFEALGFEVYWNRASRQAELTRGEDIIIIPIGSETFTTNGESHPLDVPAQIIGGRTLLPLRLVLESIGYELDWCRNTRTVFIDSPGRLPPLPERPAETPRPPSITVDGFDVALLSVVVQDDIVFASARGLFEGLGSLSLWFDLHAQPDPNSFNLAGLNIVFTADSTTVYVNDEAKTLDAAPFMHSGQLHVPVIDVAYLAGNTVEIERAGNRDFLRITPYNSFGEDVFMFVNALNANGIMRGSGNFNLPAGMPRSLITSNSIRTSLESMWNITDRESAIRVINNLYDGGHHARYMDEHRAAGTTSPWGDAGLLGWDLARVAQVASASFVAGYLSFDEFILISLPAAITLQSHFDSWEQLGENFVYGAAFWLRGTAGAAQQLQLRQDAHDEFVENYIDTLPPWDLDLSWVAE